MADSAPRQSNVAFKGISTYFYDSSNSSNYAYFNAESLSGAIELTLPSSSGTLLTSGGVTVSDGNYGDINVANSGISWSIIDGGVSTEALGTSVVTSAKIATSAITLSKFSASGTPSSSTFLRGDNQWASVTASSVAADDVTEGDAASAFGTNTGNTRLYSTAAGVCVDVATGFDIEMKINGTSMVVLGGEDGDTMSVYPQNFAISHSGGGASVFTIEQAGSAVDDQLVLTSSGEGTSALKLEVIGGNGDLHVGSERIIRMNATSGLSVQVNAVDQFDIEAGSMIFRPDSFSLSKTGKTLTLENTGTADDTVLNLQSSGIGNNTLTLQATGAGGVDIRANSGASTVRIQRFRNVYGFTSTTSSTEEATIWENGYLAEGAGTSGSYLIKASFAGVSGDGSKAASYEVINSYRDDGTGLTDQGHNTHIEYGDGAELVSAEGLPVLTDNEAGVVQLKLTPKIENSITWSGVAEVTFSRL